MKGKEQSDLNKLTENFKKRVDALPRTLASKMDQLQVGRRRKTNLGSSGFVQKGFHASHEAIDKKIAELRHQATNAGTEEEREAARRNLEAP